MVPVASYACLAQRTDFSATWYSALADANASLGQGFDMESSPRILHILGQRPGYTGSGVFLNSLAREGEAAGIAQCVVAGMPSGKGDRTVPGIDPSLIYPVFFETNEVPFPVAGMSDEMPYASTRFSTFSERMFQAYLQAFGAVLSKAVSEFRPTLIWSHHLWIVSALSREMFPDLLHVTFSHGTELRQLQLAPQLAPYVLERCKFIDKIVALSKSQKDLILKSYDVGDEVVEVLGAGVRSDIFNARGIRRADSGTVELIYAGKLSDAKGVPYLLRAFRELIRDNRNVRLTLVGGGEGSESSTIREDALKMGPLVRLLGAVNQKQLADLFRSSDILVLPSFFEGLGLVVLEALACGCRIVVTNLASLGEFMPREISERGYISYIDLPRMMDTDRPVPEDIEMFISNIAHALARQISFAAIRTAEDWTPSNLINNVCSWTSIFEKAINISLASELRFHRGEVSWSDVSSINRSDG